MNQQEEHWDKYQLSDIRYSYSMMNSLTDRLLRLAMINSSAQVSELKGRSSVRFTVFSGLDLYENKWNLPWRICDYSSTNKRWETLLDIDSNSSLVIFQCQYKIDVDWIEHHSGITANFREKFQWENSTLFAFNVEKFIRSNDSHGKDRFHWIYLLCLMIL